MSLAIAGDVLGVAGTAVLTLGTGAQAWANLAEYKSMRQQVSKAALDSLDDAIDDVGVGGGGQFGFVVVILFFFLHLQDRLVRIRAKGGDEAVQLVRFRGLARLWTILMIGSALVLAASVIQLALA
jgi:hypothetical protein